MAKQQLRRSQFVLMYGPGSLIETTNGSRLIPSLKGLGENCNDEFFEFHELKDIRMNQLLNKDWGDYECHLVSIPSNTAISEDKPSAIYSTLVFPKWHICYEREPSILYDASKDSENGCIANKDKKCTMCEKNTNPNVRFVRACPNGHLDEVYWKREVHKDQKEDCDFDDYYYWRAGGGKLEEITIECPKCGSNTTMEEIYRRNNSKQPENENSKKQYNQCSGRQPENENFKKGKVSFGFDERPWTCNETMSIIQKQSTSLRIPITITLLKIPKYDIPIFDILINSKMRIYLSDRNPEDLTKDQITDKARILDPSNVEKIESYFENHNVKQFFDNINRVGEREDYGYKNAIVEEFAALIENKESENFRKGEFEKYFIELFNDEFPLEVCGVETITTVTAQIFYQRKPHKKENEKIDDADYKLIDIGYTVDEDEENGEIKKKWYPAYLGVGEGIFLYSKKNPLVMFPQLEDTITRWENASVRPEEKRKEVTDPLFIWWHTLSHALIKSLSLSCGYSSPSLRERVYIDDKGKGGILIYNTSPGDDSGMGGLYDLVYNKKEFNRVLLNTIDTIINCSNDPLCSGNKQDGAQFNGSACHNCLLISETSCEHINKYLDRHFFIG